MDLGAEPVLPAGLYRGTAPFYDRYRPAYPVALLQDLCQRVPASGTGRLLDLACGTGQIALPLAAWFADVVAVDQEEETVAFGRAKARAAGHHRIRWVAAAAETVELEAGFELVAVGTAFHRLDRPVVAKRIFSWLRPGGAVALLWSDTPAQGSAAWQQALTALIARWMARAGTAGRLPPGVGDGTQPEPHQAVLARAGLEHVGRWELVRQERWTAETLAGFMYSTSILSRDALGDRAPALERDLAALVDAHGTAGTVQADAGYAYELARKPR